MIFGEAEGRTTTRIEALNTDAPLIREDVQGQVLWSGVIVLCPSGWVMR